MVTDSVNFLVSCHDMDLCNVNWTLGGASSYQYTWMHATYCI